MGLPIFQSQLRELTLLQTQWASKLDPVLALPTSSGSILKSVALVSGANTINHKLGRKLQGWYPVRFRGGWAEIYDTQDSNSMPDLTLTLNSSAGVTVDLFVF